MTEPIYPLYHTLNKNISSKGIKNSEKKKIIEGLSTESNQDILNAFVMLIAEHARCEGKLDIGSKNIELPYGLMQKSKNFVINFDLLPEELQVILWKFWCTTHK